jgi:hypothetical protein
MRPYVAILVLLSAAALGHAEERHARFLEAEPGVTLQPARETESVAGAANMAFLPGDRLFTTHGRAEIELVDGTLVRLDVRSRLEFDPAGGRVAVLRLSSGAAIVQATHLPGRPLVVLETEAAAVQVQRPGLVRVDVHGSRTFVAVFEGEAVIEGVTLGAGEVTTVAGAGRPQPPRALDADRVVDGFEAWSLARDVALRAERDSPEPAPEGARPGSEPHGTATVGSRRPLAKPATPSHVTSRPGPGDTVPELRYDPLTTIPPPIPRRSRDHEDEEDPDEPSPFLAPVPALGLAGSPVQVHQIAMGERKAPPSPRAEETDRDVLRRIFRQADQMKGRSGKDGKTSPPPSAKPPAAQDKPRPSPKKKKEGGGS